MHSSTDFPFRHRLRVRWAEVDKQGVVFNGHYLTYFDIGIFEYWRAAGVAYPDCVAVMGADLFVIKTLVNYHAPAEYDDWLDIAVRIVRLGNSSIAYALEIWRGDSRIISGEVVYVTADPAQRKSVPIPALLRDAVIKFQGDPGVAG
jgi:acyl-CoA thioester hydrolase